MGQIARAALLNWSYLLLALLYVETKSLTFYPRPAAPALPEEQQAVLVPFIEIG